VVKDHDGHIVTAISITPIPLDKPPHPLPVNVEVPVYFTIQPGGAYIVGAKKDKAKGGWIVYPNTVGEAPGARFSFWQYDPEGIGWKIYGLGTVTPDGQKIVPDPQVRIYEFTGAMINGGGSPGGSPEPEPCDECCLHFDGDPVCAATGMFLYTHTDLVLPGVLPIELTRTYRTHDLNLRPFGIGATHPYELFLWSANQYQETDLILPDGARVHYERISPGTSAATAVFEHTTSPTAFYKSRITWNGNGWDLTLKDGTVYVFGENAPLQYLRDRYGNTIVLTRQSTNLYGSQTGNILQITASNGRWLAFTYDASDRITQATDNTGRSVTYAYNASGRLWKVTDPKGGVTEYTYDTGSRMTSVKDARGNMVVTNVYDANGRVSQQTHADGGVFQFAYTTDANGKITQADITDPRGIVRRVVLNGSRRVVSDTRALGRPEEQTTTFTLQSGSNLILSKTDAFGRRTDFTYDSMGNRTSMTQLAGTQDARTTTWTYEPIFNQLASVTDPLGHTTTFTYNGAGALTTVTNPLTQQTTLTSNSAGQPLTITNPLGHMTQLSYRFSDLATVTDPVGNVTWRSTDNLGRVLAVTNAVGQKTAYSYDALDRLTQQTDPLGAITAFSYDANGNTLAVTDARSGVTTYTYDVRDRLATRSDPLARVESFQYDGKDNLTQTTDRKSQTTQITYDGLNRRTYVTYADGSTITYTYDAGDRVTQIVDSVNGTITRTYDGMDHLLTETTPQGTVTYTYDLAGRRTSMTVAGQATVNYTYDNANRLTQITQGSSTATFTYDNANRRTSLTLPNGVVVEYSYDNASRLTGLVYKNGAITLGNLTYTYDAAGRRLATGGAFARTGIPSALNTATYDAANQQLVLGNKSATFDANGNLATLTDPNGTTTYTWNARDQLVNLSGPSVTASFQYDAFGRRKQKIVNSVTTDFLYDGIEAVQELSGGTPTANLLTGVGIDEVLLRTDAAGGRSFLADGLGSTLALTDNTGTVQTEYTYEPFGKTTLGGAASTNAFQYTGRENDGTGLYYYRARYYHPELQRFVSEDPIGFDGGDINLYAYVSNDPVDFIDSLGLAKGGKQNIGVGDLTKKSSLNEVNDAIKKAIEKGMSPKHIKKLKGLKKVIKRGGGLGLLFELFDPDDAGAEEDMLCP
jgi:RHS repeat-associated protein